MKTYAIKQFHFIFIALTVFFISCNKESYVEGLGSVTTVGVNPSNNTGTVTIFSTSPNVDLCSNGLRVSINGEYKGTISAFSNSTPSCGNNNSKSVSFAMPEGSYNCTISGSGPYCPKYNFSITVEKGRCILQPIH